MDGLARTLVGVGEFFGAGDRLFFDQGRGPRLGEFLAKLASSRAGGCDGRGDPAITFRNGIVSPAGNFNHVEIYDYCGV